MSDFLALIMIVVWPVIPLWWIPVHSSAQTMNRFGILTYIVLFVIWFLFACLIYNNRVFLLQFKMNTSSVLNIAGGCLLILGVFLQIWTVRLLTFRGIIGLPEIHHEVKGNLVTTGLFSLVRHPTYVSQLIMGGIFFITGVITTGIAVFIDFLLIYFVIIPKEEKELIGRFGEPYIRYMEKVPKFFPTRKEDKKLVK
jgi:protein-S-isoprenylcysteine O-methyltransferase Ste14